MSAVLEQAKRMIAARRAEVLLEEIKKEVEKQAKLLKPDPNFLARLLEECAEQRAASVTEVPMFGGPNE